MSCIHVHLALFAHRESVPHGRERNAASAFKRGFLEVEGRIDSKISQGIEWKPDVQLSVSPISHRPLLVLTRPQSLSLHQLPRSPLP